ncbi:MAG: Hsp70 family protein [Pseudomonadota bacterium]
MSGKGTALTLDKRFIIGIDLGTTNCAVSYVDLQEVPGEITPRSKESLIKLFRVPQVTGPGEITRLPVLPSFLYLPGEYDIPGEAITLPWSTEPPNVVGAFARDHGAKVPSRLISSAKSWLCHGNVDRRAKILPWGAGDDIKKVSPVQATAAYLSHIRRAWNHSRGDDDDQYLENQMVIVTVPASFDEVARDLTVEAATMAGFHDITLLEEPLAAFYSWLIRHEYHWREMVQPGELILVCDVGGGTTDFTLISLRETEGSPRFERIAVGDHLILGGDNVDLTLARQIEMRFSSKSASLGGDRWKALCHQCRQAKETLLDGLAESVKITLLGEGGKLIAGTLSAELTYSAVETAVLAGFFPLANSGIPKRKAERKGISELGLPYEPEPAITRHLCWFLEQHRSDIAAILNRNEVAPDHILFNGGSLKPLVIQERIRSAIRHWFGKTDARLPRVLDNPSPELAVALGAAYYGLVKTGIGVRVGSGSARAYFLGVSSNRETLGEAPKEALCLVERGLDEGSNIELKNRNFQVLTNQPVQFDVYSSSFRSGDACGDLVPIDESLTPMPPVRTVIEFGKKGEGTEIPVQLEAIYTEVGTLALWCRSRASNHRWQLQFQLRDIVTAPGSVGDAVIIEASLVEDVRSKIRSLFSKEIDRKGLEALIRDISHRIERKKENWPLSFIRTLADDLLELESARHQVADQEGRWMNLLGFSLRPGFGDAFDPQRLKKLWKLHRQGPVHKKNAQVCAEWWILWRRISGGLTPGQQRQFSQELTTLMIPKKGARPKITSQELLEIWMLLANMEHLQPNDKIRWGNQLLSEMSPKQCKSQMLWSLSRIGARVLLYGPVDRVIPPKEAYSWCETLLDREWRNIVPVGAAVAQMARKTGDRMRDMSTGQLNRILDWMSGYPELAAHLPFVTEIIPLAAKEESVIFGEALPSGLVLHE